MQQCMARQHCHYGTVMLGTFVRVRTLGVIPLFCRRFGDPYVLVSRGDQGKEHGVPGEVCGVC
jgi:hypothetical protein